MEVAIKPWMGHNCYDIEHAILADIGENNPSREEAQHTAEASSNSREMIK